MKNHYLLKTEIPVVIAHFGNKPKYLNSALRSAANFNEIVVHIGDEFNRNFWKNYWEAVPFKLDKFKKFQEHYIHMSYTRQELDIACFKRFFAMEKWMKENNLNRIFHLDSDVMTFGNYSKEVLPLLPKTCVASLMTMEGQEDNYMWATSPHFSYWTIGAMEDFTTFCINAYRDKTIRERLESKWRWHIDNKQGGGICDMTLLYLWSKDNPRVTNLTKVSNDIVLDYNFNLTGQYYINEYKKQFGLKKFIFKEGIPYGYNKILNKWIRFLGIHCQGAGKYAMGFLGHKYLRHVYILTRIYNRAKSKYFRLSFRKLKRFINRS